MFVCVYGSLHCRWDYTCDERDNEIAELKKRLTEQERKSKDAATKAAEDLKGLASELQVSQDATGTGMSHSIIFKSKKLLLAVFACA